MSLLEMSEMADRADKQDFQSFMDRATGCTRSRDFICAAAALEKAARLTTGEKDRKLLAQGKLALSNEKERMAAEEWQRQRKRDEEARRAKQLEEEAREREWREEQAQRERDDDSYSAAADIGAHILNRANDNARIMNRLNRQADRAFAETNRRLADQAAERDRQRREREDEARQRQEQRARTAYRPSTSTPVAQHTPHARIETTQSLPATAVLASANTEPVASRPGTAESNKKKPAPEQYRKIPTSVPAGKVSESLRQPNGEYNCGPVNLYANQHHKESARAWQRYLDAPYRSEARCEALCDTLAWREELVARFNYSGSWSCSSTAVGMWGALGTQFQNYLNGDNLDRCTCVSPTGASLTFTEARN